jgi:arabinoxylan arabinofuranohydrolase
MKYASFVWLCGVCAPLGVVAQQGNASPVLTFEQVATSATAKQVDKLKISLDTVNRKVTLPVRPGTNLKHFKPGLVTPVGVTVTPSSKDFSKGPVQYQITIDGKGTQVYTIEAKEYHNSSLPGLYADPDIIYAQKTKKFYLYPTSDGVTNWLGTSFKSFSSTDLVNWKDEGIILDLHKDVAWAENKAWAPTIIERKINGKYKYFYYFCAEQKIGVATSNSPTGPFTDLGKPLLEKRPDGFLRKGQTIDPDVFEDPQTDKFYLFWGNGFMAGAELNDDMLSLKTETIKELTPPKNYTEGTHVFYRNGLYYFLWSQHDTRDPNYRVRYGTTTSLLENLTIPEDNLVIVRDDAKGIYGTGHNSTIQLPGQDEWYLVYHRFTYPNGIKMGREAGYNREVCIDKLEFNPDGSIQPVQPTHEGIKPVQVKR